MLPGSVKGEGMHADNRYSLFARELMRLGAGALVALLAFCAMATVAWADEGESAPFVSPAQTVLSQEDDDAEAYLNLLYFSGERGATVYLNVNDGAKGIAKYLPYALGDGKGGEAAGDQLSDVFALSLEAIDEGKLRDGSYTVEVYDHRGGTQLYAGALYGVWARFIEAPGSDVVVGEQLIGSRTVGDGGFADALFVAPTVVYNGDTPYTLQAGDPVYDGNLAYYIYVPADTGEGAIDATVSYVLRDEGTLVKTDTIAGIPEGGSQTYQIPTLISEGDAAYRTLAYTDAFTATNPGRTSFVVPCVKLDSRSPYHVVIRMVDAETGAVLASDTLDVEGTFGYEAPSAIHRMEQVDGEMRAVSYDLLDEADYVFDLQKDQDLVVNGVRTVDVHYQARSLDEGQVSVTFNQLDGQYQADNARTLLGTQKETVTADNDTAVPQQQIQVAGKTYELVGSPDSYAYTYGSHELPVVDVYYLPEGYDAEDPYTVTINYVDIASREIVGGESYECTPDQLVQTFDLPGSVQSGGVEYIRVDGQGTTLQHNFFSNVQVYTVYYRDASDENANRLVVTRTRIVYEDVTATLPGASGPRGSFGSAGSQSTSTASGNQPGAATLNPATGYNAVTGDGNGTLLTEDGTDSNTERTESDTTSTAQTDGQEDTTEQAQGEGGLPPIAIAGIVAAVLAALAAGWFLVARRRKNDDDRGNRA